MNFKIGSKNDSSSSLRDTTSSSSDLGSSGTGSDNNPSRPKSNSGIYDISRMTNIKSPIDPFGHNVSHFTKARAADNVKKAKATSDLVRGLIFSLAVPLVGGAIYLMLSNDEVSISGLAVTNELPVLINVPTPENTRAPAARAELIQAPPVQPELAAAAFGIETSGAQKFQTFHGGSTGAPRALSVRLSADGKLESPFSVELDENGLEVSRKEASELTFFLPPIPRGYFESSKTILSTQIPEDFKTINQARPFAVSDLERIRLTELRRRAPELNGWFADIAGTSNARLRTSQQAIENFSAPQFQNLRSDAIEELRWVKAASIVRDIDGDRSVEKRLLETMMLWARIYKATGSPLDDLPLLDALEAYNNIRHLWSTTDQTFIDGFFHGLVEAQFVKMKSHKKFDETHAAHARFAVAVGLVTGNRALQLHGLTQYKLHVERSTALKLESFGTDEVKTLNHLLRTAYALDRAGSDDYRSNELNRAIATLAGPSQSFPQEMRIDTLAVGAYFRPELYSRLAALTSQTGVPRARFGTADGALIAALRKPTSSLDPSMSARQPSNVPTKLPPKAPRR